MKPQVPGGLWFRAAVYPESLEAGITLRDRGRQSTASQHEADPHIIACMSSRIAVEAAFKRLADSARSGENLSTIKDAITAGNELLDVLSSSERRYGLAILEVADLRCLLWSRSRNKTDWESALVFIRDRVETMPQGHFSSAIASHSLGFLLYVRAQSSRHRADLDEAVEILERAKKLPAGSDGDDRSSVFLAQCLVERYRSSGSPEDLEQALAYAGEIASSENGLPANRRFAEGVLLEALHLRHEATSSIGDLTTAIALAEQLLRSGGGDDRLVRETLASLLRRLHRLKPQAKILERVVEMRRELLQEADEARQRPGLLDNLGNALLDRYLSQGLGHDLDEAVDLSRQALVLSEEGSPERVRIKKNLGLTLCERYRRARDREDSALAIQYLREVRSDQGAARNVRIVASNALGAHLFFLSHLSDSRDDLDAAIDELRSALAYLLEDEARSPVTYRLANRSIAESTSQLIAGALIQRASEQDGEHRSKTLLEALATMEATKSPLLVQALLHRVQVLDPESPDGFVEGEELSRLASFDAAEILALAGLGRSAEAQLSYVQKRVQAYEALDQIWGSYASSSVDARDRLERRRSPVRLISEYASSAGNPTLLAFCDYLSFDGSGTTVRHQAAILVPRSTGLPELVMTHRGELFSSAARLVKQEISDDAGAGTMAETWFVDLARALGRRRFDDDGGLVISPSESGSNIPWGLALERCGWARTDGARLTTSVVPSVALLALPEPNTKWTTPLDWAELHGASGPRSVDGLGEGLLSAIVGEPTSATVVGNPTGDLPAAGREAIKVAEILGVEPLLEDEAKTDSIVGRLSASTTVHIAAHATFDPDTPLRSYLHLSDGTLPAARLAGSSSSASLVVLSACEAGRGGVSIGPEVFGLVTILVRAGVDAVIASLWPSDDAATAFLMTSLHQQVNDGVRPEEALLASQQLVRSQSGWNAPYYWAGFLLAGASPASLG